MVRNKILVVFLSLAICGCGEEPSQPASARESTEIVKNETTVDTTTLILTIPCEIIWESNTTRYDRAPTIVVITDSNSHLRMHDLVNQFARKKSSKKFTLVVLDDKNAGLVYKASHYGANEVNRIATKAELKLMDKHIVGTYIGELETNGNPYEILYHGFGFEKESHENYEPKL
jgi:hypothetical protein